jgi:hypothetical protein
MFLDLNESWLLTIKSQEEFGRTWPETSLFVCIFRQLKTVFVAAVRPVSPEARSRLES